MGNLIIVSGLVLPNNGISWPSGLFPPGTPGSNLNAFLVSLNATFGFNLTTHNFSMDWCPMGPASSFHGASGQLPDIGTNFELFVGNFFLRGFVTHSDYTTSVAGGTVINLTVQDKRSTLRKVKIHTEDLGQNVPSGVVSVARCYRLIHGLVDINNDPNDPNVLEYERILENGATYDQILEAINFTFNENKSAFAIVDLPTSEQIELNIGGTIRALRFIFNLDTLDEVISRVLQDTGFDWYWNMDANKINLINKKLVFSPDENQLLDLVGRFGSSSGLNETSQFGFGKDIVSEATRFRLLGGHQHGFINSRQLSPIDGLDTTAFDNKIIFNKAWEMLSIGFYDADGFYRTYIPTEKEQQLALAGIEQWAYFKKYQTAEATDDPPGYGISPDNGSIAAQDPTFQSRLDPFMPLAAEASSAELSGIRVISNRRDAEHNWTIEFYNRVRDHASRHYGRSYVAEGLLFNQASGLFRLIDAAWANVENQIEGSGLSPSGTVGGLFLDNTEINKTLGPISPFLTDDFRVTAHCALPADTVYGPQGDDVPANFFNWTEDAPPFNPNGDGTHYIPISLIDVGHRVINPRSDELFSFENFPEGTLLCQLPVNAGNRSGLINDGVINSLATLLTTRQKLSASGLRDILNPALILNAYDSLSGVAIPVESRLRYGQGYPTTWVLGENRFDRDEDIQLDDQFVPWTFFPVGNQTSLDIMTDHAMRRVNGKLVPSITSRYADFIQEDLPLLSFDAFAKQEIGSSGLFGEISHGVSEVNISFGIDGFSTRYRVQSYFPQFGREAPLGERTREQLDGILHPIDFTFLAIGNDLPQAPNNPFLPGDTIFGPPFLDTEQRAIRVTITTVNNVFNLTNLVTGDERYFGLDAHEYVKPPHFASTNLDFVEGAICIDGFLNINDLAIYHTDSFEIPGGQTVFRYFTGGRSFGNATIVEIVRQNADNTSRWDVNIVDPTAATNGVVRSIIGLPLLNGSVIIGDKTTLAVQGDGSVKPGADRQGLFINGVTQTGGGVFPVQITAISGLGTTSAFATAQALDSGGNLDIIGTSYSGVIPIPYRQFATVGDQGFLSLVAFSGFTTAFMQISKQAFTRFVV